MKFRIDLKILFFLAIFYFTGQLKVYLLIMFFCFIHELAHLVLGLLLNFKVFEMELMPLGFFIKLQPYIKDYNCKILKSNRVELKKLFVILAGPVMNLILIGIFCNLNLKYSQTCVYANLVILLFNLMPIYPLDGGRFLKSLIKILFGVRCANIAINKISNVFMIVLTMITSILILYLKNISILFILIYLWCLMINENKIFELQKNVYEIIEKN